MASPNHVKQEHISKEEPEMYSCIIGSDEFPTYSIDDSVPDEWPSSSTIPITNYLPTSGETQQKSKDELADLLKSWDQLDLLYYFRDQNIDVNVLSNIEVHHLNTILRPFKFSKLILFESKLRVWREKIGKPLFMYSQIGPMRAYPTTRRNSNAPYTTAPSTPDLVVLTTKPSHVISLATILNSTPTGEVLIKNYERYNRFQESQRTALINAIAQYFEQNKLHLDLCTSHRIEQEIVKRFPTEKLEYYRTSKRGKIYNKFSNMKSALKFIDCSHSSRKSSADESRSEVQNSDTEKSEDMVPEEDTDEVVRSLKFDNLSPEQFDRCWKACSNRRISDIKNSDSISILLSKWPQYKSPSGHKLIDMDFQYLCNVYGSFLNEWENLQGKLLEFLSTENHVKERTIKMVIAKLASDSSEISKNCRDAAILWSLHGYIVPTQKIVKKDKQGKIKVIRCTIKDSQDSFFMIISNLQDIEDRIELLNSSNTQVLPYIVLLGEDVLNFSEIYLYFDGAKYKFSSFIRAVDCCFKIFYLFNLKYPRASESFWGFIQSQYIKSDKTKLSPKTHILLNDIRK